VRSQLNQQPVLLFQHLAQEPLMFFVDLDDF
jgi:hypothetical protein